MKSRYYLILLLIMTTITACKQESNNPAKLGQVDLTVNCNPKAQEYFNQGLLYLHSFEYLDARIAFIQAQKADSSCGMAYWGELMAYNHPLFNRELTRLANQVFAKMGATAGARDKLFESDMEKDLLKSVEILYGQGTKPERNKAYRDYYAKLAKKYKGNHEIEAFYALSLLSSPISDKTKNLYTQSAQIAQGILDENPEHPGALHYMIHSYDYPSHAHLAVNAADSYAKVAPDAAHALHMPSHIYLAMGRWNDVINSNIDSWNASVKGRQQNPQKDMGYHSLSWLQYGALQRDENKLATQVIHDMINYAKSDNSILAKSYMVAMKGAQLAGTNIWTGPIADLKINVDGLHLTKKSGYYFLEAMKAFTNKNKKDLKAYIDIIGKDKYVASLNLGDQSVAMCNIAGNPSIPPNQMDIDIVTIMEKELQACLAKLNNDEAKRLEFLADGATLFEKQKMSFGPPVIFKPIHEAYAEALIENNQYNKALSVINKGLETTPRKLNMLKLKQEVAMKTNLTEVLKEVNKELDISLKPHDREEVLKFTK